MQVTVWPFGPVAVTTTVEPFAGPATVIFGDVSSVDTPPPAKAGAGAAGVVALIVSGSAGDSGAALPAASTAFEPAVTE